MVMSDIEEVNVKPRKMSEWEQDLHGYFLIRYNSEKKILEVQFRTNDKEPIVNFYGENPEDLYYKIVKDGLITNLQHAAYLGSELRKAYIAMKLGKKYVQDDELEL